MVRGGRFALVLVTFCLVFATLFQLPQLLHMRSPLWRGIPVYLNADEYVYLARVEEALAGTPSQTAEAYIGDPTLVGSQFAVIERAYGLLFRSTGWRASTVLQVADSLLPPLVFLALVWFLTLCGFSRRLSVIGAVAFTLLQFYNLGRPIHQRDSFFLELLALCFLLRALEGKWFGVIASGALMGILVGGYFWGWTYVWAWWGIWFLWEGLLWMRGGQSAPAARRRLIRLIAIGIVGVLAVSPFLWDFWELMRHPLYDIAKFRSGMHPSRLPESWPYSVIFTVMAGSALLSLRAYPPLRSTYRAAAVTILTSSIIIHQQVVHGVTFNFVSHYLFALVLAAMVMVLLLWTLRGWLLVPGALAAAVYLAAVGYDGRWVFKQFTVLESRFYQQHFSSLLPVLDALPRTRILSDADASMFIAANTRHDVVYGIYLKNVLLSHEELAERLCLTMLPLAPEERRIEEQPQLIYPDAVSAFRHDPSVREREVQMVHAACAAMDQDPAAVLRKFGMKYVLWDEKNQPTWKLDRLGVPLKKVDAGRGWSLWKIEPLSHT